jgi:hypothetical protein
MNLKKISTVGKIAWSILEKKENIYCGENLIVP